MIRIKKGLDLPITGSPEQKITEKKEVKRVALLGDDYIGMKPSLAVKTGDQVKIGQLLFTDKKIKGLRFTSPACGKILEINRGDRRAFQSMVIGVNGNNAVKFSSFMRKNPENLKESQVKELLLESGLWTALRKRPFGGNADPQEKPQALFVTAMDTHPLAPDPMLVISKYSDEFKAGLHVLAKLSPKKIYLCHAEGDNIPRVDLPILKPEAFAGPHPAGNVGTHIHFLYPVGRERMAWHISYRDVIAFGRLFLEGKIFTEEIISIAGPKAKKPRLITTCSGANLSELCNEEIDGSGEVRRISGSLLGGRTGWGPFDYLGRYHHQVSLISEDRERKFFGWQSPGFDKFSIKRVFLSSFFSKKNFLLPVPVMEVFVPLSL